MSGDTSLLEAIQPASPNTLVTLPSVSSCTSALHGSPSSVASPLSRRHVYSVGTVSFLYALAFTILYPTLPFMIRSISTEITPATRLLRSEDPITHIDTWLSTGLLYGLVMSSYGIAKIPLAPFLGFLSDRIGDITHDFFFFSHESRSFFFFATLFFSH
jgi:MFS family permease